MEGSGSKLRLGAVEWTCYLLLCSEAKRRELLFGSDCIGWTDLFASQWVRTDSLGPIQDEIRSASV